MSKKEIRQRVDALRNLLEKYRYEYHVLDKPTVSDELYDSLIKELSTIETDYPEFDHPMSPTHRVGGDVQESFTKVVHDVRQWSYDNVFDYQELVSWESRLLRILEKEDIKSKPTYVAELKIDGLKVVLTYENGILIRAATRGDGLVGEDITENIKTVRSVPTFLSEQISITVIGEAWIGQTELRDINIQRKKAGEELYANTRNLAAGTLRQLDPKVVSSRNIQIFSYDIEGYDKLDTQLQELELLKKLGFNVNQNSKYCKTLKEVQDFYDHWKELRDDQEYGVDGVVVKVNERNLCKILGYTAKSPRYGIAYKFPAEEVSTQVIDIIVQVGRTGAITPVAVLSPVLIYGSLVSRASLHNYDEIERLGVRIGDSVIIRKAGDVIPEIVSVIQELRPKKSTAFKMPHNCPSCGSTLEKINNGKDISVALYCVSSDCPAKEYKKFIYFVSKKAFNIEGLGDKIIEEFLSLGLLRNIPDIFRLQKKDIMYLDGFGEKSAENIIQAIESSRTISFARLLYSLGINGVGEETSKDLARAFLSIEDVKTAKYESIISIFGIGDKIAKEIVEWFENKKNKNFLKDLLQEIKIVYDKKEHSSRVLEGITFVLTGTLSTLSREEAKKLIEENAGKVSSSLSNKTSYLVVGDAPGSKRDQALSLGVRIINETQFLELFKKS